MGDASRAAETRPSSPHRGRQGLRLGSFPDGSTRPGARPPPIFLSSQIPRCAPVRALCAARDNPSARGRHPRRSRGVDPSLPLHRARIPALSWAGGGARRSRSVGKAARGVPADSARCGRSRRGRRAGCLALPRAARLATLLVNVAGNGTPVRPRAVRPRWMPYCPVLPLRARPCRPQRAQGGRAQGLGSPRPAPRARRRRGASDPGAARHDAPTPPRRGVCLGLSSVREANYAR